MHLLYYKRITCVELYLILTFFNFLQISQLADDVQRLQNSVQALQEASASQIARLEEQLELKCQVIARLEARLDAQRDYEDIKREVR